MQRLSAMLTTPLLALLYTRIVIASSGVKLLECGVDTRFKSCVGAAIELDVDARASTDIAATVSQFFCLEYFLHFSLCMERIFVCPVIRLVAHLRF